MLPKGVLSYSTKIDQYLKWKLLGNCLRVRCSIYAFSSATSHAVQEASSWCWRRGTEIVAYVCLNTREHFETLCKWFNTVALTKTKHGCYCMSLPPYPFLCWFLASKGIPSYIGRSIDFFPTPCRWEKKIPPNQDIPLLVSFTDSVPT